MTTFNYLLCLGMVCLTLTNTSCTKENLFADQAETRGFILSDNPLPDRSNDSDDAVVVVDGGVVIYDAMPDTDNSDEIVVVDGGVEVNETMPDTDTQSPLPYLLPTRCKFTHTATVQWLDCAWIMVLEDGQRFYPFKGGEGFDFEENMNVKMAFESLEWMQNDCMNEWEVAPIELICIEEVK